MKVFIASAANLELEDKYMSLAREVSELFAKNNFDLLFGAGHYSMMGECYKTFAKHKRKIYAYTVPKWEKDFKRIPKAKCIKVKDTLLRFRKLYFASDFVLILPGGIGTMYEIFTAIEWKRSNEFDKPIIIYNPFGHFDKLLEFLDMIYDNGFSPPNIANCYFVCNDAKSALEYIDNYYKNKKNKTKKKQYNQYI